MTQITHAPIIAASFGRAVAIATLMSTALLVSPLTPARADPAVTPSIQLAQNAPAKTMSAPAKEATSAKSETLEQRITNLHAALRITPDEDSKWNPVAQAMRDNASSMDKLAAEKRAVAPQNMTALDDLMTYQEFAQNHVDGLKNLTSAFKTLYNSMPDSQKKIADQAFRNFGRGKVASRG
jgi:periplasmic protein CpxP/Spy